MKPTIVVPIAVLGVLIVIGAAALIFIPAAHAPVPEAATTTSAAGTATSTPLPAAQAPAPMVPLKATNVSNETVWREFTGLGWTLPFSFQPSWAVAADKNQNSMVTQVRLAASDTSILISKNQRIGMPSKVAFSTSTRSIAGQNVTVTRFDNPNPKYAYYLYFDVPVGTDTYYFSLDSATTSMKVANDFISLIK
ncbi:MAG: hypothetical protein WDN10_04930 [bacterium]